jgi:hypothetical protein
VVGCVSQDRSTLAPSSHTEKRASTVRPSDDGRTNAAAPAPPLAPPAPAPAPPAVVVVSA